MTGKVKTALATFFIIILAFCLFLNPRKGVSESKKNLHYPYKWVFKTAIRLIRVDLNCEIEEKDEEAGFIIFWYEYEQIKSHASMEIVDASNNEDGYQIFVKVTMEKFPSWIEEDLIEKLQFKLKEAYGSPPPYEKNKKKEKKEEEGKNKKNVFTPDC